MSIALSVCVSAAHADDSGVSPTRLKLPKGPGSLEGVGENAEPNINMGIVSYAVPFELPSGYHGFGPKLGLSYTSTGGSDVVGMGWSLPQPRIERMTSKGLPTYSVSDGFATDDGTELVRVSTSGVYRARFEGSFVRYTWTNAGNGRQGYWKAEYPDGRVGYFGARADGQLVPEARLEGPDGTFAYHLVEMVDVFDHRIRYEYVKDGGRPYLTQIGWVDSGSGPRYEVELSYEPREDVLSDGKPGFEVRLTQRLRNVRVRVRGAQLRRYALSYEPYAQTGGLSRLASVTTFGMSDREPYPVAFRFAYTRGFDPTCAGSGNDCPRPRVVDLGSVGADFRAGGTDLIDLNGDALPDVVHTLAGAHLVHRQNIDSSGRQSIRPGARSAVSASSTMRLDAAFVQLVDLDGDGFTDMVDGRNGRVLWNRGRGDWDAQALFDNHLPDLEADANLRFVDVDYDRRIDVLRLGRSGSWYYRNLGGGVYARDAIVVEGVGRGFSEDGLDLADMNGDGMLDVVQKVPGGAYAFLNLGYGRFASAVELYGLPTDLDPTHVDLTDLNGDGLADAVVVQGNQIRYALNRNGESFGALVAITSATGGSIPERTSSISIRFADMNGSGSTDVVYIDASGRIRFVELFPERPHLLRRVDNGIGKVIEMSYASTVEHMARDGGPDAWTHRLPHPMLTLDRLVTYDTLSNVQQIQDFHYRNGYWDGEEHQFRGFEEVEVFAHGDASMEPGRTVHRFDVGATDRYRKGLTLRQEVESDGRTLTVTEQEYADCRLTGVPTSTTPRVRFICPQKTTTTIREGRPSAEWVTIEEAVEHDGYGNVVATHKLGVTKVGGGACGPCMRDASIQGEPCGPACVGDELHETLDYVPPDQTGGRWILRAAYRKRSWGAEGATPAEELTYYDGPEYQGMPLGRLARGVPTRKTVRRSASASDYIEVERVALDRHGNVVSTRDANGHERRFEYDADALLTTAEVVVFDDPGHPAYALRMEVVHDPILDQPTESTGWMRVEGASGRSSRKSSFYTYDDFGRLTSLARPGDPRDGPSQSFLYDLGEPVSRIVTLSRTASGSDPELEHVQCFDGHGRKVQERTRVTAGRYQVSGFSLFNIQGKEHRTYQPFVAAGSRCDRGPPANVLFTSQQFDAAGRPTVLTHSDEAIYGSASRNRIEYRPLRSIAWDAEDDDASSPHHATPSTTRFDGLERPLRFERLLASGSAPLAIDVTYDTYGRLRSFRDAAGHEQIQAWDLAGRVVETRHPDRGRTLYEYDAAGNEVRRTDARGVTVLSIHDEANRILATWESGRENETRIEWRYDAVDGCSRCTHTEGLSSAQSYPLLDGKRGEDRFGFDERGRPIYAAYVRDGQPFEFEHRYDSADREVGRSYPGGIEVSFVRDGLSRIIGVPGFVDEVTFTDRAQLDRLVFANGVQASRTYDARMRTTGLITRGRGASVLQSYAYRFDREGHVLAIRDDRPLRPEEPSANQVFDYDALYRLKGVRLDPASSREETLSFEYDAIDNLVLASSSLGERSAAHVGELRYGEAGAGPHALTMAGIDALEYDRAGQVIERAGQRYTWDFLGRLVEATQKDELVGRYAYGAGLDRALKEDVLERTHYLRGDFELRDGIGTVLLDLDGMVVASIERADFTATFLPDPIADGTTRASDAYAMWNGQGEPIAGTTREVTTDRLLAASARRLLLGDDGQATTYWHGDHLGSVAVTTDESGALLERVEHYPFGQPRFQPTTLPIRSFTGMERDRPLALSYHSARYLDTRLGRWLSPDPKFAILGEAALQNPFEAASVYAYVNNSPINLIDPTGLESVGELIDQLGTDAAGRGNYVAAAGWATLKAIWTVAGAENVSAVVDDVTAGREIDRTEAAWATVEVLAAGAPHLLKHLSKLRATRAAGNSKAVNAARETATNLSGLCFAAGTLVHTEDGLRPIEQIVPGDRVWSFDAATGEIAIRSVTRTFINKALPVVYVELIDEFGRAERITVTDDHPFFTRKSGWKPAVRLSTDDELITIENQALHVVSISRAPSAATVHNLEVEDAHTYYVGKSGCLVHVPESSIRVCGGLRRRSPHPRVLKG